MFFSPQNTERKHKHKRTHQIVNHHHQLIKKEPGHSLIEVQGAVEKFTVGRILNPRIDDIVGVLKVLSCIEDEFSWC